MRVKKHQVLTAFTSLVLSYTIISCSYDNEFDDYYREELETYAEGEMRMSNETNSIETVSYKSCGIWCIAKLKNNKGLEDDYDYVQYKAELLNIPTEDHISTSKMVTLAKACDVNLNYWITNMGQGVPQDTIVKKLQELKDSLGQLPVYNILGFSNHYVIGKKIVNGNVEYIDPNFITLQSKNINSFSALIY